MKANFKHRCRHNEIDGVEGNSHIEYMSLIIKCYGAKIKHIKTKY